VTNSCGSITSGSKKVTITCLSSNTALNNEKLILNITQLRITPNPFSNTTTISFSLSQSSKVSIGIYDVTGRLVQILANTELQQGTYKIIWNARDEKENAVSAGIYFLNFSAGSYVERRKLVVAK
jgi:hypothetical protein